MRLGGTWVGQQSLNLLTWDLNGSTIRRVQRIANWRDFTFVDELIELRAPNVERLARLFDRHVITLTHSYQYNKTSATVAYRATNAYNKYITDNADKEKKRMAGQWGEAKAIETVYQGCKFRSRLEARWAVFFDEAKIEWTYETEGFDLDGVWYLPDFWLPKLECWIEIKPTTPTEEELAKVDLLREATRNDAYLFVGLPGENEKGCGGYGPTRFPEEGRYPEFAWSECPYCGYVGVCSGAGWADFLVCPCAKPAVVSGDWIELLYWLSERGNVMVPDYDEFIKGHRFRTQWAGHWGSDSPLLRRAYLMAKQARFEKGKG